MIEDISTGEDLPVSAKAIVNATGAWLDEAMTQLLDSESRIEPFVSGTKGSHLILDCAALYDALSGHMVFFENSDGRVCIVFPYLGKVLAGSTDIRVETAGRVRCELEERDYILDAAASGFSGHQAVGRRRGVQLQRHSSAAQERSRIHRPHFAGTLRPSSRWPGPPILHGGRKVDDVPRLRRADGRCRACRTGPPTGRRTHWGSPLAAAPGFPSLPRTSSVNSPTATGSAAIALPTSSMPTALAPTRSSASA